MGYYIFSFGIKQKEILKAFNSKDKEIIKKVKNNEYFENYDNDADSNVITIENLEELKEIDFEEYINNKKNSNKIKDNELTLKTAVEDIVNGKELNKKYGYTYGYVLISLCSSLGQQLPYQQEIKLGYETDYINQFLVEDFGLKDFAIDEFLFSDENINSFPIPNIEDFPMLSVVKLEKLKKLKSKLSKVIISDDKIEELLDSDDEEKGYSYEHIKGIIDNIDFCIKNELDLFSACH